MYSFCNTDDARDAINQLVEAKRIVIYCGAGVSISKTHLSWSGLVESLLKIFPNGACESIPKVSTASEHAQLIIDFLENEKISPLHAATLFSELITSFPRYSQTTKCSPKTALNQYLHRVLYRGDNNLRASGSALNIAPPTGGINLLDTVTKFILSLIASGKEIAIITTNYDTYLEGNLLSYMRAWSLLLPYKDSTPLNIVTASQSLKSEKIWKPNSVSLLYLHGRVPREDDISVSNNGRIVFSEADYAESEKAVTHSLQRTLNPSDCMLILGASVEDTPLIRFLQQNKSNKANKTDSSCKSVILVKSLNTTPVNKPRPSKEFTTKLLSLERLRYSHIGIDYYIPLQFFSDVSIFLKDVNFAIAHRRHNPKYSLPENITSTIDLLRQWTEGCSDHLNKTKNLRTKLHKALQNAEPKVKRQISLILGDKFHSNLVVRIELWIRGIDPAKGDVNRIVRVADSDSLLTDFELRRTEYIYRRFPSRTAAVRALQFGNDIFAPLNSFGEVETASRWQGFYAIPIITTIQNSTLLTGSLVITLGLKELNDRTVSKEDKQEFQNAVSQAAKEMTGSLASNFLRLAAYCTRLSEECIEQIVKL